MLRAVAMFLTIAVTGPTALAADLPQTRLGAVFAKPQKTYVYGGYREFREDNYPAFVFAPLVDIPPIVGGYYGKPFSYYYKPYYESEATALTDAYTRLPYACGFFGYVAAFQYDLPVGASQTLVGIALVVAAEGLRRIQLRAS